MKQVQKCITWYETNYLKEHCRRSGKENEASGNTKILPLPLDRRILHDFISASTLLTVPKFSLYLFASEKKI